jgi:hypothetical protein
MHISGLLNGGRVWISVSKVYAAYVNYIMWKEGVTLEIASCRDRKVVEKQRGGNRSCRPVAGV